MRGCYGLTNWNSSFPCGNLRRASAPVAVSDEVKNLALMLPGLAVAAIVYIWLNEVRYHLWWDQGLNYIPNIGDTIQNPRWGTRYFVTNLRTLLWMAPKFDGVWPFMHPTFIGQGLLWTSPAFLLTFSELRRPRLNETFSTGHCVDHHRHN